MFSELSNTKVRQHQDYVLDPNEAVHNSGAADTVQASGKTGIAARNDSQVAQEASGAAEEVAGAAEQGSATADEDSATAEEASGAAGKGSSSSCAGPNTFKLMASVQHQVRDTPVWGNLGCPSLQRWSLRSGRCMPFCTVCKHDFLLILCVLLFAMRAALSLVTLLIWPWLRTSAVTSVSFGYFLEFCDAARLPACLTYHKPNCIQATGVTAPATSEGLTSSSCASPAEQKAETDQVSSVVWAIQGCF